MKGSARERYGRVDDADQLALLVASMKGSARERYGMRGGPSTSPRRPRLDEVKGSARERCGGVRLAVASDGVLASMKGSARERYGPRHRLAVRLGQAASMKGSARERCGAGCPMASMARFRSLDEGQRPEALRAGRLVDDVAR